ncbi:hypothetical protein V494_03165 [Pseudogymnoascus sp. VKM F-4513 (FW-928)]|nr:hypothetical protein V494_03165 [Pseudogymnoascus sp. VKM F-4513 (FW-928)]
MTDQNHHIPDPHSEEDNHSEKDSAAHHLIRLNESLNIQNDTHEVKALQRHAPDDLVFTSMTIAPSPPPPTVCAPPNSRAALSSLNTSQQRHTGASSSESSPVSATRLRVQRSFTSRPSELERSDSNQERRATKAIPIARTPSIKQVLASSVGSNSYTGSAPNSALSSPQLNAMPDLTPLPSPIMSNDSPGPWRRRISRSEYNESRTAPLTGDTALVTPSGELIPSAIANESKRRAYHGLLNSEEIAFKPSNYKREKQTPTHSRNRSMSEYTPDPQTPRKRQQSVSGTYPKDNLPDRAPPVDSHMRREPNLALQRGIAPVPRPPTPPSSRTGGESSESDSAASNAVKPMARDSKKKSKPIYFDAVTIASNEKRRWRALKLLGEGTFSKVVLATSQLEKDSNMADEEDDISLPDNEATESALTESDTKKLVAVKICEHGPKGGASEERVEISLKRELELMKSIHHPSLVDLQAWSMEESRAILVLGYCPGGDLFEVASQRPLILVPSLLQRIFAEIVFAIQYLHERRIVHRDIKLENVLVNLPYSELAKPTDWSTYPYSVITVTDLGLARYVTDDEKLSTRCGSDDYAAPEVIMGQPYDGRAVDAWSLGVLLYALLESRLPFDPNPGLSEGHKQRSRTSHRIARVEWRWLTWEGDDGDHEADEAKFEAAGLKTAMEITENLLKRARSRWTVDRVAQLKWVTSAIQVDGGIRFRNEEEKLGALKSIVVMHARLRIRANARVLNSPRAPTYICSRSLSSAQRLRNATPKDSERQLNKTSATITQPKSQGASQAMLYATGMDEERLNKAQVGISSVWHSGNPCNMHLLDLNHRVKEGVERAGLVGYQFNTIGVSDGISMGTTGMRYSLQSRDLIADSIETVMGGQWYDANISIPGCDKNMPGVMMAMGRVNRPSLMVYGGSIKPGCSATQGNADIDIVSAFQAYGQFITGEITEEVRYDIIRNACPGGGACGGMYTANTMATAIEVMGMTLPGSSSNPAESKAKYLECLAAGGAIKTLLQEDIRPSDILTRQAFENAMIVVIITGGSTNAVLHLIAIADSVGIKLTIDDFQAVSDRIPFLADLKPSGKYVMADLHNIGGTPSLLKFLLKEGLIDGSGMTVTGKTLAKNLEAFPEFPTDQTIIRPLSNPIKETGHIQILYGSLSPGGSVGKITGKEGLTFTGKARVYDAENLFIEALERGEIKKGEKTVVVIRYEGPKGGPGMPEMLKPSSAIMGAGLGKDCALITDGRFSGGSHGFLIGHVVPEAQEGGPIALVRDGDEITIDAETKKMDLHVSETELAERRKTWVEPPLKYKKGTLAKYARLVSDASRGCITDGAMDENQKR